MISLNNIHYRYEPEGIDALRGVTLEIKDGEYVAVIGPNGCGKTTLIRHLNALLLPEKGSVVVNGLDTKRTRNHTEIRSRVGMIFQNPDSQIVGMTAEEDVSFGPENLRLPADEIKKRVADALQCVGITMLASRNIENLSGGEKRLVAIAGVLAMNPRYIALDEPTAFLDPAAAARVLEIMDKLHDAGVGIIHVTHNMAQATLAERVVALNEGRVYLDATPREVFGRVELLQQINLCLPQLTQLFIKLKESGLPTRTDIVDIDEAVKHLKKIINNA